MSLHAKVLEAIKNVIGDDFVALYLVGSYDTHQEIVGSDIDYILVISKEFTDIELDRVWKVRNDLREKLDPEIDILPRNLSRLIKRGTGLKREGRLIGGTDIRDQIEIPPKIDRDEWLLSVAKSFMGRIHGTEDLDPDNLDYPDCTDYYFGYPDYNISKPFVPLMSLSFLVTAWLSKYHDVIVTNKHQIPKLYGKHIGANRLPFLEDLFQIIRSELGYRLPKTQQLRDRARGICQDALEFEKQLLREIS